MSEEVKVFLTDMAVASAVGLAVGAMVACAAYPLVMWWHERKIAGGGRAQAPAAVQPAVAPSPGVVSCDLDDWPGPTDTREAFERLMSYTEGRK